MDEQHPNTFDRRPKRRKDKDNPYQLFTIGIETPEPLYFIRFKDGQGIEHCLMIDKMLFELLDSFEREDMRFLNELERHRDMKSAEERIDLEQSTHSENPVEEDFMRKLQFRELHIAINQLTAPQRRRISLYYFGNFTLEDIAKIEGNTPQAIGQSILKAEKNLKKFLKGGLKMAD